MEAMAFLRCKMLLVRYFLPLLIYLEGVHKNQ